MSDAHAEHDLPHEGPIKTPRQLLWAVVLAFVVPIIVIVLLVNYVVADKVPAAGSDGMAAEAVARRIQPIGSIEIRDASDTASLKTGEQVYAAQCVACHGSGAAGAPKIGDAVAWGLRVKAGYESLLASALRARARWARRAVVTSAMSRSDARWSTWPTNGGEISVHDVRSPGYVIAAWW